MKNRLLTVVLCLLALPVAAEQHKPYFSLTAQRTFAPGEKITVSMYSHDVEALEFRMYRVQDPVKFFTALDDAHQFGSSREAMSEVAEQIDERTWLEKFHDWKMRVWRSIRNFFRFQFRPQSRAVFRQKQAAQAEQKKLATPLADQFAQVPILNSKQLVSRWRQQVPSTYFSDRQDLPVESQQAGVYLIEATDGELKAYTVVIVSQTALITKVSEGELFGFLVDRKSGAPVSGAKVTYWADKKAATPSVTDDQGVIDLKLQGQARPQQVRMIAVHGDDVAVVTPQSYLFGERDRNGLGYVFTDRPVYRPGHTVHIKAVLRQRNGEQLRVPEKREVSAVIYAADNKQALTKKLALSAMGTANFDFVVPSDAALGYYRVEIDNGNAGYGSFYVEEYKKPEYQVKVTTDKQHYLQGESIKATIEARYYFGEPVANAKVVYVVHTSRHWNWESDFEGEGYEGDEGDMGGGEGDEDDSGGSDYMYGATQEQEQEGKLDADGKLVVTLPTRVNDKKFDLNYRIEARVTDAASREISGHNMVLATYGSYWVGIQSEKYLYAKGETPRFIITSKNYENKPISAAFKVQIQQWSWNQGRSNQETIEEREGTTGPDGTTTIQWPTNRSGSFHVKVISHTPENRDVEADTYLWLPGEEVHWWWGGNERKLQVIADKKNYQPGDVAHMMVMSPVENAHLLITAEGRSIQSHQVVTGSGTSASFDVPITSAMSPNIFINAVMVSENEIYQGAKELKVPPVEKRLQIEITPSKPQFQPGEKASYDVVTKDSNGKPVQAELAVGVVDDAIYAVRPDTSGDLVDAFYQRNYRMYNIESSLTFYFHGEAGEKSPLLARLRGLHSSRLAQLKPGSDLVQPKVRKAFPDTAFWAPTVTTDAGGHARVSLDFPDSLTTWRTTVRAITADTRAGSEINRVIVRKNLMVRLAVPRFFRQGDEVTISTIVHNYLANIKTAKVSLEVTGLQLTDAGARDLTIPSKGEAKVDWHVKASQIGDAKLLAKALTNEESDAMELTLPVEAFGVRQIMAHAGSIVAESGSQKAAFQFPQSDPLSHSIDVSLSPSVAGSMLSALDYLTNYPYGCTEQTMSSFLPNIVVGDLLRQLNMKSDVNEEELRKKIRAGSERLYDFQHQDGGWGWWKDDESHTFMTAYVVAGLAQAKNSGYDINEDNVRRGQEWLRAKLKDHPNMIADLQAYVTYALAVSGDRDHEALDAMWEKRDKLTPQGLAHAGLALQLAGDARAEQAASDLEKQAKQDDMEAYWVAQNDYLLDIESHDDSAAATATALKLLSLRHPESPLLPKAALWLVNHRDEGWWWESTKQTAMVLYGLTDYLRVSKELSPDFSVQVLLNGKQLATKKFGATDLSATPFAIKLDASQLANPNDELEVRKTGKGRVYWSTQARYFSTARKDYQSASLSLSIARDYFKLRPETTTNSDGVKKIVYALDPLNGSVQSGDIIAVHITLTGADWKYLLIEDPIPAGVELLERDDLYELKEKPRWWGWYWTRREFHDDRAAFFEEYFHDKHDYYYLLKVVNPGVFQVSPALAQPMYQPSVMATTESRKVEVK
jgi:uncharacterized protein YfaS (alpha-2-macroglobulin family)